MTLQRVLGASLAGLLIGLLVWLPARTLAPLLPAGVQCAEWAGRAWDGGCARLVVQNMDFGEVRWGLRSPSSRTLIPELELRWARADSALSAGLVMAGSRQIEVRRLRADLAFATLRESLPAAALSQLSLPRAGRLRTTDLSLRLDRLDGGGWRASRLAGTAKVTGLVTAVGRAPSGMAPAEAVPLGDYEVTFGAPQASSDATMGQVRDLGGPIQLRGDLLLQPAESRYRLTARLQARSPTARQLLESLGPSAPDGSRELSLEGGY
ncbi:MAG: type II secretion system protein N [Steroidobacteraceae bacterium]|jgi:Type II secretion system (T2SS), protein N